MQVVKTLLIFALQVHVSLGQYCFNGAQYNTCTSCNHTRTIEVSSPYNASHYSSSQRQELRYCICKEGFIKQKRLGICEASVTRQIQTAKTAL